MNRDDIPALLGSWTIALKAEAKSPNTIRAYTEGVRAYLRWYDAARKKSEVLSKASAQQWCAELLAGDAEPATVLNRQRGARMFTAWLAAEGELDADPLTGLKPPKQDQKIPQALSDDQVTKLLGTCTGSAFHDVRDNAIIRLMTETMVRSAELLAMTPDDVDLGAGTVLVSRGKGGRGRWTAFSPQTAKAVDKYMRARRRLKNCHTGKLWVSEQYGKPLTYSALWKSVAHRGQRCGVDVSPHALRRTGAIRWKAAGGSTDGLMAVAGWKNLKEAQRYTAAAQNRLGLDEARRLGLGAL